MISSQGMIPTVIRNTDNGFYEECRCAGTPAEENWQVGKESFESTADLVENLSPPAKPVDAVFSTIDSSRIKRLGRWAAATAIGGAIAGGVGAFCSFAVNVFIGAAGFAAPFFGTSVGATAGSVLGPALVCAGIGMVVTGALGVWFDHLEYGEQPDIKGQLATYQSPEGPKLQFKPDSDDKAVDLELFAGAQKQYVPDCDQWYDICQRHIYYEN